MLNFEEELAKFKPSRDIDQVEDTIVNRDITDITDIMVEFLKEQYKDEFLIFDLTFVFLSVLILSSLLGEMAQFFGHTVRFSLNNISLDSVFRILYAIDYWNNNPKHCGTNSS